MHLERKHSDNERVKGILALDKTDPNRKRMIDKLRKEGDFYAGEVIPVQKKKTQMVEENSCDLIPCVHCKGRIINYKNGNKKNYFRNWTVS
ncbi:hypothetical protein Trydic_g10252 [Trypoxylus dichotomus]